MTTDYKEQDRKKILDYLASRGCEEEVFYNDQAARLPATVCPLSRV